MNYLAILIASVVQFAIGAIWYGPIFGKIWGKIHGHDLLPLETQKQLMKEMPPLLIVQMIGTIITTIVLSIFITYLPNNWNVYALAAFFWIGFVVPTHISAVLFGGTKREWMVTKILIMSGASFLCFEIAAIILKAMM